MNFLKIKIKPSSRHLDKKFFMKVQKGYKEVAKKYKKIVRTVDGKGTIEEVEKRVWNVVEAEMKTRGK